METTEKVVESYCRYIKQWFTLPNIKCKGQYEIDLLAVDTTDSNGLKRYHVECGVSISGSYSKLTDKGYSEEALKVRVKAAEQRRTFGYFLERKFGQREIIEELKKYGFEQGNYERIIVSWGWTEKAKILAEENTIRLWDFRELLKQIALAHQERKTYFTDDTARTIQLFARAIGLKQP
jgi:hypothetical protein